MTNSIKSALTKYSQKQIKSNKKKKKSTKRKGIAPEKQVEKEVMPWLKLNGFSCNVVESKAVYNPMLNRYVRGQTDAGFPDIAGCTPYGYGAFIELKAKGTRRTLKEHQRAFLIEKIECGAFAVCVDGVECLREIYIKCSGLSKDERVKLLKDHLPKKRVSKADDKSFFD